MAKAKFSLENNGVYATDAYKTFPDESIDISDDLYKKFINGEVFAFDVTNGVVVEKILFSDKDEEEKIKAKLRLHEIDLETMRPLRAVYAGTDTPEDHAKLEALENESVQLREELNAN